jgi:2-polyprenyl-6-methoxyphenol hydroxylase-like FAD-dependent oxidoreductase
VLLSAIAKNGIEIVYEKALQELSEAGDVVELVFGDGTVVTSGLVIGADGLRSTVRKAIAPDAQPYYNGLTAIYGLVEKEQLDQQTLAFPVPSMILGPEGSFAIIPVDPAGNRLGFLTGLQLPDRRMEEWQAFWKDKDGLKALLVGSFGKESWPKTVQALCRDTLDDEVSAWP